MICRLILFVLFLPSIAFGAESEDISSIGRNLVEQSYLSIVENDYKKSLKVWFMANSIKDHLSDDSYDAFKIPTWMAIDKLDICPTNMPSDTTGSGLTPVVLHNFLVRHYRREIRERDYPAHSLTTFERNIQRRPINFASILSEDEIRTFQPFRSSCPSLSVLTNISPDGRAEMGQRENAAHSLHYLIGLALAESHISEPLANYLTYRQKLIELYLVQEKSTAAAEDSEQSEEADTREDSEWEISFLKLIDLPEPEWHQLPELDKQVILSLLSRVKTISLEQRKAQYVKFLEFEINKAPSSLIYPIIGYITQGAESMEFVNSDPATRITTTAAAHGFSDSAAFYGRLGVKAFQEGDAIQSLEYFAKALKVTQSTSSSQYSNLSMSWIKYVMLQYRFDKRLLKFLKSYLSTAAFNTIVQSLAWSASFHGEPFVFRKKDDEFIGSMSTRNRKNITKLRNLGLNRHNAFIKELDLQSNESARSLMTFVSELVSQLEKEPLPIIKRNAHVLRRIQTLLAKVEKKHSRRTIADRVLKINVQIDELLRPFVKESLNAADRRISKDDVIPLGGMYVQPSDPWPWPFPVPNPSEVFIFRSIPLAVVKKDAGFAVTISTENSNL